MWVIYAVNVFLALPVYLILSFVVVAFEKSGGYIDAAAFTAAAVLVLAYVMILPAWARAAFFVGGQPAIRSIRRRHCAPPTRGRARRHPEWWGQTLSWSPCYSSSSARASAQPGHGWSSTWS